MKTSDRSRPRYLPKFPRLLRLREMQRPKEPKGRWFATADVDGNVSICANSPSHKE